MTANDQTSGSFKDKEKFLSALKAGDVEYLKAAISQGLKPRKIEPSAMLLLASLGEEQCMRLLLAAWGKDSHCSAIETAARMGHAGCVAALLPHCDPKESRALRFAAQAGEVECVRLLASIGNVSEEPTPLFMAAHGDMPNARRCSFPSATCRRRTWMASPQAGRREIADTSMWRR